MLQYTLNYNVSFCCCICLLRFRLKVKWSHYRPGVAQRVGRCIALLFRDRGTRRGWVVAAQPGRTLPPGKTRYLFCRRMDGPQGRSGRAEKLVPTRIRSRTVQPVVSRYTDWATRPTVSFRLSAQNCWFRRRDSKLYIYIHTGAVM